MLTETRSECAEKWIWGVYRHENLLVCYSVAARTFWEPLVGRAMSATDEVIERRIAAEFRFIFQAFLNVNMMSLVKFLSDEYRLSWLASSIIKTLRVAFTLFVSRSLVFSDYSYGCMRLWGHHRLFFWFHFHFLRQQTKTSQEEEAVEERRRQHLGVCIKFPLNSKTFFLRIIFVFFYSSSEKIKSYIIFAERGCQLRDMHSENFFAPSA